MIKAIFQFLYLVLARIFQHQDKKEKPDERYQKDIQAFDEALAAGDADGIAAAFDSLPKESGADPRRPDDPED